jgi:hypothetical protein
MLGAVKSEIGRMSANANRNYEAAQSRLSEIYDELQTAGMRCEGMQSALRANMNRPDRDRSMLLEELIFEMEGED